MCILAKKRLGLKLAGVWVIWLIKKSASEKNLVEFSWVNVSPNRRVYEKEGEKYSLIPFSLCNCFNCKTMAELALWKGYGKEKRTILIKFIIICIQ